MLHSKSMIDKDRFMCCARIIEFKVELHISSDAALIIISVIV